MKQPALGKKILELRKQKGFTQEELVEKCNINVRTIQRIEAGNTTPRSYTIKAILTALGEDYEIIDEEKSSKSVLEFIPFKKQNILKRSWVFGLLYFVIGFFEMASEYSLIEEGNILFGIPTYTLMKLINIISFFFLVQGIIVLGELYKNYMLEIVAFIILIANTLFGFYDIISFIYDFNFHFAYMVRISSFGILLLLLGIAIVKLKNELGVLPIITGVIEVIAAICILFFVERTKVSIIFPIQLLEIILLYVAYRSFKIEKNYS